MGEREWEATLNQGDSPHSLTLVYAPLPLQTLSPDCNTTRKILKYYSIKMNSISEQCSLSLRFNQRFWKQIERYL